MMPIRDIEFEVRQGELISKIQEYLRHFPKYQRYGNLIEAIGPGLCNGLSAVWLYAKWLQTQPNPDNKPRDDYDWFRSVVELILNWIKPDEETATQLNELTKRTPEEIENELKIIEQKDPERAINLRSLLLRDRATLSEKDYHLLDDLVTRPHREILHRLDQMDKEAGALGKTDTALANKLREKVKELRQLINNNEQIERFVSLVLLFQGEHPQLQPGIDVARLDKFLEFTKNGEIGTLKREYSIAAMLTLDRLKQILVEMNLQEGKLVLITSFEHATALFKKGYYYYYFDPNTGGIKTDSIGYLVVNIYSAYRSETSRALLRRLGLGLGFQIFSFEKGAAKYPSQEEILDRIKVPATSGDELIIAATSFSTESAEYFLRKGIEPNSIARGWSALTCAALGNIDLVRVLLKHPKIDPNIPNGEGITALMFSENTEITKELLKHPKIDPNIQGKYGRTALMVAIARRQEYFEAEGVKMILAHPKTDPNIQDKNGCTALIQSILLGDIDITKMLINHPRTNLNIVNKYGWNVLMVAEAYDHDEAAELLRSRGCTTNSEIIATANPANLKEARYLLQKLGITADEEKIKLLTSDIALKAYTQGVSFAYLRDLPTEKISYFLVGLPEYLSNKDKLFDKFVSAVDDGNFELAKVLLPPVRKAFDAEYSSLSLPWKIFDYRLGSWLKMPFYQKRQKLWEEIGKVEQMQEVEKIESTTPRMWR